jgi:hypothetical protein
MKEMVIGQLEKCEKYLGITKRNQTFQLIALVNINIFRKKLIGQQETWSSEKCFIGPKKAEGMKLQY